MALLLLSYHLPQVYERCSPLGTHPKTLMSLNRMYSQKWPEMGASALWNKRILLRSCMQSKRLHIEILKHKNLKSCIVPRMLSVAADSAVLGDDDADALVVPAVITPAMQQYLGGSRNVISQYEM